MRVAAARARHDGAGPHAGRGPHARRHGAAASPGGGWGACGRAEGARGEGRAEFDSRRAYGTHSRNPYTTASIIPTAPPASRLEAPRGLVPTLYSGCYLGSSRHGWAAPRLSTKVLPIPVKTSCEHGREREEWFTQGALRMWAARAAARAARVGLRGGEGQPGFDSRGTLPVETTPAH